MEEMQYILNETLPLTQNYKELKLESIAFIEEICGDSWTNLNDTDPGITILEQVCYALTELGYCADFPIKDLLTNEYGKLDFSNQFYHPQNVLTTSPITKNDYIKYLVDRVEFVKNVTILKSRISTYDGLQVMLVPSKAQLKNLLEGKSTSNSATLNQESESYRKTVWNALNNARNLDEVFNIPDVLKPEICEVKGELTISADKNIYQVIADVQQAIAQYIYPDIPQAGYDELIEKGYVINEIFNSPKLQHGWIMDDWVKDKKDQLTIDELIRVILNVSGVVMADISFASESKTDTVRQVSCSDNQLLVIHFPGTNLIINDKSPEVWQPGFELFLNSQSAADTNKTAAVSTSNLYPDYPIGTYKEVSDYYSVQHTMPEIYGVGDSIDQPNASPSRTASVRQLKAYLTLFDQVLANYFSQLDNVDKLLGFKITTTGAPTDEEHFYAIKDTDQKKKLTSPAPYKTFSPAYFYQSLYETVPNIRPILKNNQAFEFSMEPKQPKVAEDDSWEAYQNAPYNAYIYGLKQASESSKVNENRKNQTLDHLLARNGESPETIDRMIKGTSYSGNEQVDRIMIKSVYLQCLDKYTYFRYKAYNFLGAEEVEPKPTRDKQNSYSSILESRRRDFIYNVEEFEKEYMVSEQDFVNYSTAELVIHLFFGLNSIYRNLIVKLEEWLATAEQKSQDLNKTQEKSSLESQIHRCKERLQQITWFIQERKGLILLEKSLLHIHSEVLIYLKLEDTCLRSKEPVSIDELTEEYILDAIKQVKLAESERNDQISFEIVPCDQLDAISFKPIDGLGIQIAIRTVWGNNLEVDGIGKGVVAIFPDYLFKDDFSDEKEKSEEEAAYHRLWKDFEERLQLFAAYFLPAHLKFEVLSLPQEKLTKLIPAYTAWHNVMSASGLDVNIESQSPKKTTRNLVALLMENLLDID